MNYIYSNSLLQFIQRLKLNTRLADEILRVLFLLVKHSTKELHQRKRNKIFKFQILTYGYGC